MNGKIDRNIALAVHVFLLAMVSTVPGRIIYVDADANGADDGTSWADAFNFLQDALADANSPGAQVETRVAQGIYEPDANSTDPNGSGDRQATFQLINGVTIKGGYAGFGEPDPNERDTVRYETILSGDLNRNDLDVNDPWDLLDERSRTENSYHVVVGTGTNGTAVLDGFTITGGNANGSSEMQYDRGGAIYNGADFYGTRSNPSIINCTFRENSACFGGAIGNFDYGLTNPTLTQCMFRNNAARIWGGGVAWGDGTLTNCTFIANWAGGGGGLCGGGGLYCGDSEPSLLNCEFRGNLAEVGGGGVLCIEGEPRLVNCIFSSNSAGYGGGMFCLLSFSTPLTNCTFIGNSAKFDGGGMYSYDTWPTLTNCTFSGNLAGDDGGGLWSNYYWTVTNCILWGNTAPGGAQIYDAGTNSATVSYSDVEGTWPGLGNIDADPCFVDPGYWDSNGTPGDANDDYWVDGDYHLKSEGGRWDPNAESWVLDDVTSACIDKGDWSSPIGDEPYPNGGRVNMGAYGGTAEASKSPVITCWEAGECAGQRYGDATCDGVPSLADLFALKAHFGKSAPWTDPECCVDFNHDDSVNLADLFILKFNFGSGPYSPSTLNQNCPP